MHHQSVFYCFSDDHSHSFFITIFLKHRTYFWLLILFFIVEGVFRLVSVICKKYTNTNGKGSKYTNTIKISIIRSCGGGGGTRCKITCRRRGKRCRRGGGRHNPSAGERVGSWLSSSISSFNLFMYFSYDFFPRSCLLGSFITFSDVLSMSILSKNGKG